MTRTVAKRVKGYVVAGLILAIGAAVARAPAADVVKYRTGKDSRGRSELRGAVLDYDARELTIDVATAGVRRIPADRIIDVQAERSSAQIAADASFARRKFDEAHQRYRAATREEKRPWAQAELIAQMIRCDRAMDRPEDAGEAFLDLLARRPQTRYFDAIPLAWDSDQARRCPEAVAARWLSAEGRSPTQLLGASYLLSGSRRSAAIRTLGQLATDRDQRVALLAQSQLWRTTAVTTPVEEVRRWRTLIHRLDAPLRGGPYFVWGQALAQKGDHDAAAFSLYRAAVLFPGDRPTAAAALLEAGTALEQAGRRIEAAAAYRELVDDYALQRAYADEARRRLAAMKSGTPRN